MTLPLATVLLSTLYAFELLSPQFPTPARAKIVGRLPVVSLQDRPRLRALPKVMTQESADASLQAGPSHHVLQAEVAAVGHRDEHQGKQLWYGASADSHVPSSKTSTWTWTWGVYAALTGLLAFGVVRRARGAVGTRRGPAGLGLAWRGPAQAQLPSLELVQGPATPVRRDPLESED